jgi:hypothetical protein
MTEVREYFDCSTVNRYSMKSSRKSVENRPARPSIIAEGGAPCSQTSSRDPFAALDDLMCVVEALIPTWPPRAAMKEGRYWLL